MRFLNRVPAVAAPLVLLGLAGCSGDKVPTYEPVTDPAQVYLRLALSHAAITMATATPYDTLQLTATPLDARGEPIKGLPAPTFHMSNPAFDTVLVQVSPDGILTARQPTTDLAPAGVFVVAELVAPGNVRHVDSALVKVTSGPPPSPLDSLWVEIAPPDSTIWAALPPGSIGVTPYGSGNGGTGGVSFAGDSLALYPAYQYFVAGISAATPPSPLQLAPRVRALDAAHNPIAPSGLAIEYRSLDPDIVIVSGSISGASPYMSRWVGDAAPRRAGQARMVVQATAYGVTKADTITFTVTPPSFVHVVIQSTPGATSLFGDGGDRTIRTNGVVMWLNTLDRPVDLVFDQPEQVVPAPADWCFWASIVTNYLLQIPDQNSHCPAAGGNLTVPQRVTANDDVQEFLRQKAAIWKTAQLQQFTQAGTYTYHDAQSGASGRIIVVDVAHE